MAESLLTSFRLRRLTGAAPPVAAAVAGRPISAGLFGSPRSALAFLGLIAGAGLVDAATARRSPGDRGSDGHSDHWWIEVDVAWSSIFPYALSDGRIFAGQDGGWAELPRDGGQPGTPAASPAAGWPVANLGDLVATIALRPAQPVFSDALVVTVGNLAGLVLRRAAAFGLAVDVIPATRRPLSGGPTHTAALFHLRWEDRRPPRTLLHALSRLPHTVVARPVITAASADARPGSGLLVDIGHAPPPAAALLASLIPETEGWLLGGPDAGHWRLDLRGPPVDGLSLLDAPRLPVTPPLTAGGPVAALSGERLPLRLAACPVVPGSPDAVLLDDDELGWTRRFLIARPAAAETAYLLPGPGRHLLLAPGGLLEAMPFGVPLRRFEGEPLLLEEGQGFFPPLPAAARSALFGAGDGEVVVVTRGPAGPGTSAAAGGAGGVAAARFALSAMVPVWQLWRAEPPPVATGVHGPAVERLQYLIELFERSRPASAAGPAPAGDRKGLFSRLSAALHLQGDGRDTLLRRALEAENAGDPIKAAELLEQAGDLARAGRLYERAAGS
jgi:hypothetical protein